MKAKSGEGKGSGGLRDLALSRTEVVEKTDLPLYRERTRAMLRRYFRLAVETGRLPSALGREFFRARVTSYRLHTFEDAVIFIHDMERCLDRLDATSRQVIARIVLQGYTEEDTARLLQRSRRHVVRLYPEALDRLSAILLEKQLLAPDIGLSGRERGAGPRTLQACGKNRHGPRPAASEQRNGEAQLENPNMAGWLPPRKDAGRAGAACQEAEIREILACA